MEYKRDKRTKNLTLRDIHVGDWVQEWSPLTERYGPPTKVMSISDDGDVLLIYDDKHRLTPNEARIENIDALPIDADLLRGFGFNVIHQPSNDLFLEYYRVKINDILIGELALCTLFDTPSWDLVAIKELYHIERLKYMHELVGFMSRCHNDIKLEWKGVE